ncbi:MAG: Asp-tRNA(Asn)/Glu-tRNA(Gln) amidotransferase subunit GatC [Alphaproteobacteria bacterium]|nr:Asp-tRNA(Asn)/Glu-tRNA(Gln) amidotransferase subunit GatC [Alphaproteobacteria bacterium]
MALDKATVAHVAKLARIKLDDAEIEKYQGDLNAILDWMEQLNEVDTDSVEPMTAVVPRATAERHDVVTDGGRQDAVTENAPDAAHGYFVVPKVVE